MKKIQIVTAVLAFVLAALACSFSASTANIKDAWTSRDELGEQHTSTYEPNETFYVKVELGNSPDDTKVKTAFTAVDVEGADDNKALGDKELTAGSGTLTFSLSNSNPWPAGKYKAEIFLNGESNRSLDFEVKGSQTAQNTQPAAPTQPPQPSQTALPTQSTQPVQPGAATITNAFLAQDQDGKQPANSFSPSDTVYTIVNVEAPNGAHLKAVWIAASVQGLAPNTQIYEYPFDADSSGQYWVRYTPQGGRAWDVGSYTVDLYVNDNFALTLEFSIEETPVRPSAASITDAYMSFDENGAGSTTVYSQDDAFFCIVTFDAPGGATIKAEWYAVDTQDSFIDSVDTDVSGVGKTWFNLTPNGQWSIGTYRVDLYINGQFVQSLDFEVQ